MACSQSAAATLSLHQLSIVYTVYTLLYEYKSIAPMVRGSAGQPNN